MKTSIIAVGTFLAGAAIGSVVTWRIVKAKYDKLVKEEIASVKEVFSKKAKSEQKVEKVEETPVKPDPQEVATAKHVVSELGYSSEATFDHTTRIEPFVFDPYNFDDAGYETDSLTYYADGILAYENGAIVEDVEDLIGPNALKEFEKDEDDSVFVRNEEIERDFEIVYDHRKYSQAMTRSSRPHEED